MRILNTCGIFGYYGDFDYKDFKLLAVLNEQRGKQSFGYATKNYMNKKALSVSDYLSGGGKLPKTDCVIGHTRLATTGAVVDSNAHPFRYGTITGVHNGIIYNMWEYEKDTGAKFNVDSETIFHALANFGVDGTAKLSGYGSVLFFNKKTLYFFTHNGEFSIRKSKRGVIFSSSDTHLAVVNQGKKLTYRNDTLYEVTRNGLVEICPLKFKAGDYDNQSWKKGKQTTLGLGDYYSTRYYEDYDLFPQHTKKDNRVIDTNKCMPSIDCANCNREVCRHFAY